MRVDLGSQLESAGIELEVRGKLHRFISVYIPPRREINEAELENLFVKPRTLVGGDFNANTSWGCRRIDVKGKILWNVIRKVESLEVFAPAVATSVASGPSRRGDILDIFLAYKMAAPWEVQTQFALNSDHFPVTAKIGGDPLKARISSRTDWTKFNKLSGKLGLNRVPIGIGKVTEEAVNFTRDSKVIG